MPVSTKTTKTKNVIIFASVEKEASPDHLNENFDPSKRVSIFLDAERKRRFWAVSKDPPPPSIEGLTPLSIVRAKLGLRGNKLLS